jgi:hypothetical protein
VTDSIAPAAPDKPRRRATPPEAAGHALFIPIIALEETTMNRRTALQALSFLTAGAFGVRPATCVRVAPPPASSDFYDYDDGQHLSREKQAANDRDRYLLLPAVWEVIDAIHEVEAKHRNCDECDACIDAPGMLFQMSHYQCIFDSEVIWTEAAEQAAKAERERRCAYAKAGGFDADPSFRVLVALNQFEAVLKGVLERHKECYCWLCSDVWAMDWQVSQYATIWSGNLPGQVVIEAEKLAGRGHLYPMM